MPVPKELKAHTCFTCDGPFITVEPDVWECPCGVKVTGQQLRDLDGAYRVPFLLKREALIAGGQRRCRKCDGKGGPPLCYACLGDGAEEVFNFNGKCWQCKRHKDSKFAGGMSNDFNCDLCGHVRVERGDEL